VLGERLAPAWRIILETYGVRGGQDDSSVIVHERGDVYARDDGVYWGFSRSSLDRLGRLAGRGFELVDAPEIAATRGSSPRSRRADQAAWSRRSGSSAASSCGRSVVSASGRVRERALGARRVVDRARGDGAGLGGRVGDGRSPPGPRRARSWKRGRWPGEELEKGGRFGARPEA